MISGVWCEYICYDVLVVFRSQEVRITGTFYITDHYFAFVGKKTVDLSHMELNRQFRDVMRHDEVITIQRHSKSAKGLIFTDIGHVKYLPPYPVGSKMHRIQVCKQPLPCVGWSL